MRKCGCNNGSGGSSDEKILSESGFRYIISKLSGKILLALGGMRTDVEEPLVLEATRYDKGWLLTGHVEEATCETSGLLGVEDKKRLDELWEKYQKGELGNPVTYEYERPEITRFAYGTLPAEGGSVSPVIEFTQVKRGSDGSEETFTQETTDYEVAYKLLTEVVGASLNPETGAISMGMENESTVQRQVTAVQAVVTANGMESVLHIAYVTQAGAELSYEYDAPVIFLNYADLPNEVGASVSPGLLVTQKRTGNDGSTTYLYMEEGFVKSFNADDTNGLENAELDVESGVITVTAVNFTEERLMLGVVNCNVTVNGRSSSIKVNPYQMANDDLTYGDITITKFQYGTLPAEGGFVTPEIEFTQPCGDSHGNDTVLTEESTDYVAMFSLSGVSELGDAYIDPGSGGVSTDYVNHGDARVVATVRLGIIANGVTSALAHQTVTQEGGAEWSYNEPEVTLGSAIYAEPTGSATYKVYFNLEVKENDATYVFPSHIEIDGVKYYVESEYAVHRGAGGEEIVTHYSVEVVASATSEWGERVYSAYEIHSSDGDVSGYVASTNLLVWTGGEFRIWQ